MQKEGKGEKESEREKERKRESERQREKVAKMGESNREKYGIDKKTY